MCVCYTFHPKEFSITLLIGCAKCLHEELFAHQRNAAGAPAHDQRDSQKVWRQNPGLQGGQSRGGKWKTQRWPLTWCFCAQFQQNNPGIVCETCVCTQSPSLEPLLGVPPSLCTEIKGSRSDPGTFWALTIPLDSAGAAPSVALETPRYSKYWQKLLLAMAVHRLFLKHSPWMFPSYIFFFTSLTIFN